MLLRVGQTYLRHTYTSLFPTIQLVFNAGGGFQSSQIGTDPRYAPLMMLTCAYHMIMLLYSDQMPRLTASLNAQINAIQGVQPIDPFAMAYIRSAAQQFATQLFNTRASDGGNTAVDGIWNQTYFAINPSDPREWAIDPISQKQIALGSTWSSVVPLVLPSASYVQLTTPPASNSTEFIQNIQQVVSMGGDGTVTPTVRSAQETETGIFWAYDGTPTLCAPVRLYNQLSMRVLILSGLSVERIIRTNVVANIAMSDGAINCWEEKYRHRLARPVTYLRNVSGIPSTPAIADYTPYGAPASNTSGPNFSPPFPAYPSGHSTFGAILGTILQQALGGNDAIRFSFISDEFNGQTRDANSQALRPVIEKTFHRLSDVVEENGQSRIYLGIHYAIDKTSGVTMGTQIGNYVTSHVYA